MDCSNLFFEATFNGKIQRFFDSLSLFSFFLGMEETNRKNDLIPLPNKMNLIPKWEK